MTAIFAHRGSGSRENTLAAFAAARAAGADGVELDVRLTADARLAVHHDRRIPGVGDVTNLAASDLPPYVPQLADALLVCEGMWVNIEVKQERGTTEMAEAVVGVLAPRCTRKVLVSSFDAPILVRVRALDPAIPLGLIIDWRTPVEEGIRQARELGCATMHPFVTQVSRAVADRAHEAGLGLHVWTVNAPEDIAAMLSLGVAAIITDNVGAAVSMARAPRNGDGAAG